MSGATNSFLNLLNDLLITVIVSVLALRTLMDTVYLTGLYKLLGERIENWFLKLYTHHAEQIAKAIVSKLKRDPDIEITGRKDVNYSCISPLVKLLAKNTLAFFQEISYGGDKTKFYVNTLGASLNKEDLEIMSEYIIQLIKKFHKEDVDFIVSPKTGNVLLGYTVARKLNSLFLIVKSTEERSRIVGEEKHHNEHNIEGISRLIDKINNNSQRQFKGVIVDCNFSGGPQILTCFEEVNSAFSNNSKISLKEAFVLYKVDDSETKEGLKNYKIYKYFDLDEETKEMLYEIKQGNKVYNNFTEELREKGKLF